MVEATAGDLASMGMGSDGNFLPKVEKSAEELSPMERGRKYLDEQLAEFKDSDQLGEWRESFKKYAFGKMTDATMFLVDVQEGLSKTPVGANIDSLDDLVSIGIIFGICPAYNFVKKQGQKFLENRKEAA